jgi:hypothetical protein
MSTSRSFEALRRANPRSKASFAEAIDAAAAEVRLRIATAGTSGEPLVRRVRRPRRLVGVTAAGAALAAGAAVVVFLTVGSSGVTPGVEDAAAAMKKAVTLTNASAEHSGTADVRMTHDGRPWAHKVVRWNGNDLDMRDDSPGRARGAGRELLVVDGMMYAPAEDGRGWVELGSPASIDPGSGTTPADYLAAVREDVGGTTLRRIVAAMTGSGLTTVDRSDGSTVYSGSVAAGQIATEADFKEGQPIRVFPFGYVAHDEAADPTSPLDTAVTVGPDGVVREIAVTWGTWTYTVSYRALGSTSPLVAPANAKSIRELRRLPPKP